MDNPILSDTIITKLSRFDPAIISEGRLEVIVKYSGDILSLTSQAEAIEILNCNFAIVTGTAQQIRTLSSSLIIEYIELPKTLTFELSNSRYSVCLQRVIGQFGVTGRGTVAAIIDSGIDITHPDFQNEDGTSRILYIWDQTAEGTPPQGFRSGNEYTKQQIDQALTSDNPFETLNFRDTAGHGTAVAGALCGNGRASGGREQGIAPEASIIVVKLGQRGFGAFSRTTEVMRGVKYAIDKARLMGLPLSINLSYGTNNGSHDGNSLFEQYLNSAADEWKTVISVATGNEGAEGHHYSSRIVTNGSLSVPFFVSGAPRRIFMTLWKNFSDTLYFNIRSPSNSLSPQIIPTQRLSVFTLSDTDITVFYGQPTPLTQYQEIFFLFESRNTSLPEGLWNLEITADNIVDGRFDIWLPNTETVTEDTAFATPDPRITLTLPSTASRVISVGGYNANTNTAAPFSGRGFTRNDVYVKPDITAPAVDVLTTRAGGGYMPFSGTSIAAPFVSGAACLMMEWGIVQGNDPNLYGQRLKAFLQKGAKRTESLAYPNDQWGYGTLCLSNTFDLLTAYNQGGLNL